MNNLNINPNFMMSRVQSSHETNVTPAFTISTLNSRVVTLINYNQNPIDAKVAQFNPIEVVPRHSCMFSASDRGFAFTFTKHVKITFNGQQTKTVLEMSISNTFNLTFHE